MKFQYKVWKAKNATADGAFRVRLFDGAVLGVKWRPEREIALEEWFKEWAAQDEKRGKPVYRLEPPKPMPKTPKPEQPGS